MKPEFFCREPGGFAIMDGMHFSSPSTINFNVDGTLKQRMNAPFLLNHTVVKRPSPKEKAMKYLDIARCSQ